MQLNIFTFEGASNFIGLELFGIAFIKKIRIPGASIFQYRSSDGLAFVCAIKAGKAT